MLSHHQYYHTQAIAIYHQEFIKIINNNNNNKHNHNKHKHNNKPTNNNHKIHKLSLLPIHPTSNSVTLTSVRLAAYIVRTHTS